MFPVAISSSKNHFSAVSCLQPSSSPSLTAAHNHLSSQVYLYLLCTIVLFFLFFVHHLFLLLGMLPCQSPIPSFLSTIPISRHTSLFFWLFSTFLSLDPLWDLGYEWLRRLSDIAPKGLKPCIEKSVKVWRLRLKIYTNHCRGYNRM